ncbi:hypothetical protein BJ973_003972 [Actinoplanes tereljensis]|uniref:DUF3455 domain-containing protein n=1 Tax=Paractinoplanes tereljensis TaxID=571912 RepID=A0A919NXI3_9ACTN|nr:DUF3455 domain-containing protein [Actinoplanes tereljensis]GIF25694.1 hypothetical protein Ate02nite_84240 [Actinoplanes tereljensis]
MLNTRRSRVRALGGVAMAAVVAGIGAVTFNASAATVASPAAPAPFGPEARSVKIPLIAEAIRPPAGSRPIGAYVVVNGTQNYTCVVPDGATVGAFTGKSTPEAQLLGTGGRIHHFAGPSWQSTRDQSLVTAGSPITSAREGTIPELRLTVLTHTGKGILDKADYINRLLTSGGVAPTTSCAKDEVKKVPYGAVYVFWDAPAV